MKKFLIFISIIFLSIFAFFFSNIKGYYRFKQYCEAEGGLRVYEPLERNVGWAAKDKEHAAFTSVLDSVGFVRYIENDKELDLYPIGDRNIANPIYEVKPVDKSIFPKYELVVDVSKDVHAHEPSRVSYLIKGFHSDKVLVSFTAFYYGFFDSERMPLNTNQKFSCFDSAVGSYSKLWVKSFNLSFK